VIGVVTLASCAQGTTLSWLAQEETIFAAMQLLWLWIERYGIPQSLYTDLGLAEPNATQPLEILNRGLF